MGYNYLTNHILPLSILTNYQTNAMIIVKLKAYKQYICPV